MLPPVEPVEYQALDPADAREWNASIPFVTGPNPAARPFRFAGTPDARARAIDCLAAAVYYEAGDDAEGERAVAQVVLNRLRHPAFPKTVCGVVFQGAERATGCQFTFTCDGAMARTPSAAAWGRAQDIARAALSGSIYRPVGYATHYHTDWVVPYWSASLDKIAEVHTHLFFRWTGWWGTPPAFRRTVSEDEPVIPRLAALSPTHRLAGALLKADTALAGAAPYLGPVPTSLAGDADTFVVALTGLKPEVFRDMAATACGTRNRCKFMGWIDRAAVPDTTTLSPQQINSMSFSYLRDRESGLERALWNCTQFTRPDPSLCMRRQATLTAAPAEPTEELRGVRRQGDPEPASAPANPSTAQR